MKLSGEIIINHLIKEVFEQAKTNNLILRRPVTEDAHFVLLIEGDPETIKFRATGPLKNMHEALNQINIWLEDWSTYGYGYWMISLEGSDILGIGGVRRTKWNDQEVLNLYYRFLPKAWGKGYATELARYVISLARQHLPKLPIVARIRPSNIPSLKVAERSGLLRQPSLDSNEHIIFSAGWK